MRSLLGCLLVAELSLAGGSLVSALVTDLPSPANAANVEENQALIDDLSVEASDAVAGSESPLRGVRGVATLSDVGRGRAVCPRRLRYQHRWPVE